MTLIRALPLLLALAVTPPSPAAAQFGGMPGTPGGPAMEVPFGAAPAGPPPACQQLLTLRDEMQRHGQALQAAGQKRAAPDELCRLFKVYLAAGSKMAKGLEEGSTTCGVPADVPQQVRAQQAKESQMATQICEVAATSVRPSRFDAPVPRCTEKMPRLGIPCVD
jgi:hypothetical protein